MTADYLRLGRICRAMARPVLAACVAFGGATAAASPPDCVIAYRVAPLHEASGRRLDIALSFPAGERHETFLRLTPEWAGVSDFHGLLSDWTADGPGASVDPADRPNRWRVTHPPGGRVVVHFSARATLPDPDDGQPQDQTQLYRTQIGADWFQFFGHGVLPSVEPWGDNTRAVQCVHIEQGSDDAVAFSGHGHGKGRSVQFRVDGSPGLLRDAFYAGGTGWRLQARQLATGMVHTAMRGPFSLPGATFADSVAALIDTHRRFWGNEPEAPQWVVLTPNFTRGNYGGTLVHRSAVLHAASDFSPGIDAFEFLVAHENLHQWIPRRFGGMGEAGEAEVAHYWFSEGFTNHVTHRLLLASGLWTLDRYAQELTRVAQGYLNSPARNASVASIAPRFFSDRDAGLQLYSRGELLALRWDHALRTRGQPGLDAVLHALKQPAIDEDSRAPLATTRVLAALEPLLHDAPREDVARYIERGETLPLDDGLAGPCIQLSWRDLPRWDLGFDSASFKTRVLQGVAPNGPAHAAGLRDGMSLVSWSVYGGDVGKDVEVSVTSEGGAAKALNYKPVAPAPAHLPVFSVRPDAVAHAACQAWLR